MRSNAGKLGVHLADGASSVKVYDEPVASCTMIVRVVSSPDRSAAVH